MSKIYEFKNYSDDNIKIKETPYTEQIILDGTVFGVRTSITIQIVDKGNFYAGDSIRHIWRMAHVIEKAVLDNLDHLETYEVNKDLSSHGEAPKNE